MQLKKGIVLAALLWVADVFSTPTHAAMPTNGPVDILTTGDSFEISDKAYRGLFFILNHEVMSHPDQFIQLFDGSQSGAGNTLFVWTNMPMYLLPVTLDLTGPTNLFNIHYVSANGALSSNAIRTNMQWMIKFPTNHWTTLPFGYPTNDFPTFDAGATLTGIVVGDWPYPSALGDLSSRDRSYGGRTAALEFSWPFYDAFVDMSNTVVSLEATNAGHWWWGGPHPANELQFIKATKEMINGYGEPTNIFTAVINLTTGTAYSNFCAIANVVKWGNSVRFTFRPSKLSGGYYVPDGVQTNDVRLAFGIEPGMSNKFYEIIRLTNCASGTYEVMFNGTVVDTILSARLEGGWNNYTCWTNVNPLWQQKTNGFSLLAQLHDIQYENMSLNNSGGNAYWRQWRSYANAIWPTNPPVAINYMTNADLLSFRRNLMTNIFVPMHSNAQPQTLIVTLHYVGDPANPPLPHMRIRKR